MRIAFAAAAAGLLLLVYMALLASSDPIIRHFDYAPPGSSAAAGRLRLVLLTDTHVAGPNTPPARLARIVRTVNALKPDIILLGGDFIGDGLLLTRRYGPTAAIAPLAELRASAGVIAVLGNHDHWSEPAAIRRALAHAGIKLLDNDAVRIGALAIGGVDDDYTGHADVARVTAKLTRLGGIAVMLSHSPDIFPQVADRIGLVLAGHTHCGQIRLPLFGAVYTASRYGKRFACGLIGDAGQTMIVSAGIGTSLLPLRFGAAPDLWVIDINGAPS